jgi:hypothetical protein
MMALRWTAGAASNNSGLDASLEQCSFCVRFRGVEGFPCGNSVINLRPASDMVSIISRF